MEIALKAAETGHLVMATLHTSDAIRTVNRMLALMNGDAGENRFRIASCLQGIIAQRLLPRADGSGRHARGRGARRVAVGQGEPFAGRRTTRRSSRSWRRATHPYGMETFQMSVTRLLERGLIDEATANEALI